ncbi:MAG TPA: spore coat U domain-containing protein [Vicinamibacterales bacterium]|nr:spore coat U domain-containing protein [Vicinamibacterales bacterium]
MRVPSLTARFGLRGLMIAALCLAGATSAAAQQAPSCTISAVSVAFGNYNVFTATPVDSAGSVTFRCNAAAANISITLSKGTSSTFAPRTMTRVGEALNYNLYLDAARTNVWGDGSGGTSTYTNVNPPNNQNVTLPIYGRIPASQDVSAGLYSDTVLATVNF